MTQVRLRVDLVMVFLEFDDDVEEGGEVGIEVVGIGDEVEVVV